MWIWVCLTPLQHTSNLSPSGSCRGSEVVLLRFADGYEHPIIPQRLDATVNTCECVGWGV